MVILWAGHAWGLTVRCEAAARPMHRPTPAPAAGRFNTWLDDPRTESRTTGLGNFYQPRIPPKAL
jgi:hypothetical protein